MRVAYISGFGHSGSTLAGDVLGSLPHAFHAGEVIALASRLANRGRCDCGLPYSSCPVWGNTLALAAEMLGTTPEAFENASWYQDSDARSALYGALSETTDSRVIIDGSKKPQFGELLVATEDLEVTVIHLVRDGRASVHSRLRRGRLRRLRNASEARIMLTALADAVRWVRVNQLATKLGRSAYRFLRVRYEDLASNPTVDFRRTALALGLETPDDPSWPQGATIEGKHTVWGNRDSRNLDGPIRIRPDNRWLGEMRPAQLWLVSAVQMPALIRYGYGISTRVETAANEHPD